MFRVSRRLSAKSTHLCSNKVSLSFQCIAVSEVSSSWGFVGAFELALDVSVLYKSPQEPPHKGQTT